MSDTDFGEILNEWDGSEVEDTSTATSTAEREAPAPEPSAAPSEDAGTPDESSGRSRDEHGRFTAKAKDDAETAPPAPAPVTAETQAPAPDSQPDKPFTYRAMGQELPIEGAVLRHDGSLVVPPASLPAVQDLLARGQQFATQGRQQIAELTNKVKHLEEQATQPTLNERRYEAAYKLLAQILDDDATLAAIAVDPERKALYLDRLNNVVERVAIDHERSQRDRTSKVDESAQRESLETTAVTQSLGQIVGMHAELTAEDKEHLGEWVKENRAALIREATQEDAQQWGVQVGERVVDNTRIMRHAQYIANLRKQAIANATKVQDAARFNRAQQPNRPAQPRATSSAPAPAPSGKPAPTGKQSFDDTFRNWGKSKDLSFGEDDDE